VGGGGDMFAVVTKYIPATDSKPQQVKATYVPTGDTIFVDYIPYMTEIYSHEMAFRRLIRHIGILPAETYAVGQLDDGFVFVQSSGNASYKVTE
jgi:hypothetical protein